MLGGTYTQWVMAQTREGIPVLEIHGQGGDAGVRSRGSKKQIVGVIGRRDSIMAQELTHKFKWFPLDWKNYAIPRCGGVLLETFNTDKVRKQVSMYIFFSFTRFTSNRNTIAVNTGTKPTLHQSKEGHICLQALFARRSELKVSPKKIRQVAEQINIAYETMQYQSPFLICNQTEVVCHPSNKFLRVDLYVCACCSPALLKYIPAFVFKCRKFVLCFSQ